MAGTKANNAPAGPAPVVIEDAAIQIPILLDRAAPVSLTVQLVDQIREAVRHGRIRAHGRLPSSRALADQLGISRNTVVRAYDALVAEGYVEARPASGLFAAGSLPDRPSGPRGPMVLATPMAFVSSLPQARKPARVTSAIERERASFDFFPGRPSAALFPLKTWRRFMQACLSRGGAQALTRPSDPAGFLALRVAIAGMLAPARGIEATPDRVIVTGGIREGIALAARLFLGPGTTAVLEDPCYRPAAEAFEEHEATLLHVEVDAEGLKVADLPDRDTALVYVTPSHQFPTGHALSPSRRRDLGAWAARTGCLILEDDYDGDFRYEGGAPEAIAALAPDHTIYLGTFSTSLGSGLRLGYMIVPAHLVDVVRGAKAALDGGNPWLEQATLADMIRSGSFATHLLRLRSHYRANRDVLLDALHRHFGDIDVSGEQAGLHLLWHLPPGVPNAQTVEAAARRLGAGVYAVPSGGAFQKYAPRLADRSLVLGFAALSPRQIDQGIARLSDAIDDCVDERRAGIEELFSPNDAPPAATKRRPPRRRALAPSARRRPALPEIAIAAPGSPLVHQRASGKPMPVVTGIYRYPIKGLSPQPLAKAALAAGEPFPFDRVFALVRPGAPVDTHNPRWAKKGLFLMLMLDEALARVRTHLDADTLELTIAQGNQQLLAARLADPDHYAAVEDFFYRLVPSLRAPPKLVRSRAGHFMDKPDNVLSLINLATVRALEEQWGYEIDPLRFRANFYIDGARPWEEFGWIGRDIRIGDTLFSVDRRNGRCGATNVNPGNGRRDLDLPASLRAAFGHKDLGVYVVAKESGAVAVGDALAVPHSLDEAPILHQALSIREAAERAFICRGCYFIYREKTGLPSDNIAPGTAFADLPAQWRCPDCGTDKATFRPYVHRVA